MAALTSLPQRETWGCSGLKLESSCHRSSAIVTCLLWPVIPSRWSTSTVASRECRALAGGVRAALWGQVASHILLQSWAGAWGLNF